MAECTLLSGQPAYMCLVHSAVHEIGMRTLNANITLYLVLVLKKFKFRVLESGLVPCVVTAGIHSELKIAHHLIAFDVDISKN